MSTFDALQKSLESSRPIELYEFTLGTEVFRFTSSEDDVPIGADTFLAEPGISRGRIVQGSDRKNRNLTINMSALNEFAKRYTGIPPGVRATVRAFAAQRDETPSLTTVLIFTGLVQAVRFVNAGTVAEVTVRSIETALNQRLPRFTFMASCNNFLYDQFCQVDPSLHNIIGTVTATSGNLLTVSGVGASLLNFTAGFVRPTAELDFRLVRSESGDVLTMDTPFASNLLGENVQVFAGCDHLIEGDCALVYDNVAEFGGFAFVPNKNVFQTGLD